MTTPTVIVAANGYTRDHVAIALNGGRAYDKGNRPMPLVTVSSLEMVKGTIRFVTDNDLDDGVFQVVGQE